MTDRYKNTDKIDEVLRAEVPENEGDLLVGWVIAYEVISEDGRRAAGYMREGSASTPWQSIGLLQWAHAAIMSSIGRGE